MDTNEATVWNFCVNFAQIKIFIIYIYKEQFISKMWYKNFVIRINLIYIYLGRLRRIFIKFKWLISENFIMAGTKKNN